MLFFQSCQNSPRLQNHLNVDKKKNNTEVFEKKKLHKYIKRKSAMCRQHIKKRFVQKSFTIITNVFLTCK